MRARSMPCRLVQSVTTFLIISLFGLSNSAWAAPTPGPDFPKPTPASPPPSMVSAISQRQSNQVGTEGNQEESFCTVTFTITGDKSTQQTETIRRGNKVSRPANPTRQGYLFDGWFIDKTNQAYDFSQPVTTNLALTTHWTKASTWGIKPSQGPSSGGTQATITTQPTPGIRFAQISTGEQHTLAISSDGNLYSWGDNSSGQLGAKTATTRQSRPVPVSMPEGVSDSFTWIEASAGYYHSLALGSDGNLYSWGFNRYGQLGNGKRDNRSTPGLVSKPAGVLDTFTWTQVSAGKLHTLAFGSDGNLYSWGTNADGQLGIDDEKTSSSEIPLLVHKPDGVNHSFTWARAWTGHVHSLALGSDGNLYAWGNNGKGQLGNENNVRSFKPVLVLKPLRMPSSFTWTQASAGYYHSLALGSDGNLYSWGDYSKGRLGRTNFNADRPGLVNKPIGVGSSFIWTQASAGYSHSLALGSDGNLYAWGANSALEPGMLGNDTFQATWWPMPKGVDKSFTWTEAEAGNNFSLVRGSDGNLYSWGWNSHGQLGDGTTTDKRGAVHVTFPGRLTVSGVTFDDLPSTSTPSLQDDGTWLVTVPAKKSSNPNQTVDVTVTWTLNEVEQPPIHLTYTYLPSSYEVTFITTGDQPTQEVQTVQKRGRATRPPKNPIRQGYLFDGWFINDTNQAYDFNQPVTADLTLTTHWTKADSTWTISPNLGPEIGGTQVTLTPPELQGIRFSQTSTGYNHSLAIASDGNLYSWGQNDKGQLGDGLTTNRPRPGLVSKPEGMTDSFTWIQVSTGGYHSLALGSDGNLYSWGYNKNGQLGNGTTIDQSKPGLVSKPDGVDDSFTWTQVSTGYSHSLAFGSDGNLYSWGYTLHADPGEATDTNQSRPVLVSKPDGVDDSFTWKQASAGYQYSLALGSDGNLYSWGWNGYGQLGDGTSSARPNPGLVSKPDGVDDFFTWTQASTGGSHSLAFGSDGNLYSWGWNGYGQLGDESVENRLTPVLVRKPIEVGGSFTWVRTEAGYSHSFAFGSDGNLYSWGRGDFGQLGDKTKSNRSKPGLVNKPTEVDNSFTWTKTNIGNVHSLALGSDGNLYSWGSNAYGQLGNGTTTSRTDPGLVTVLVPEVTGVKFGQTSATGNPEQQNNGTWLVPTPEHLPGDVPVTISWKLNTVSQADDTTNTYTYMSLGVLPNVGGSGIIPILLLGLIIMGIALARTQHSTYKQHPINPR